MKLLIKRTKLFMNLRPDAVLGTDPFMAYVGVHDGVPEWVKDTDTYKTGISDGSIINLDENPNAKIDTAPRRVLFGRLPDTLVVEGEN